MSWDRAAAGEGDAAPIDDVNSQVLLMGELVKHVRGMEADAKSIGTAFESKELRERFMTHREGAMRISTQISTYLKQETPATPQSRKLGREFATLAGKLEDLQRVSLRAEQDAASSLSSSMQGGGTDSHLAMAASLEAQGFSALDAGSDAMAAMLAEREAGIEAIARDTAIVHEMFVDVSNLVAKQGEDVDVIEDNASEANTRAAAGTQHLLKAQQHQQAERKKLLYFLALILVLAGAVVGFVLATKK